MEQTKRTAELTRSFNSSSLLSLSAHPTETLRSHQAHLKSLISSRQHDISARAHDAPVREYELVHAKRTSPGADEGLKRTAWSTKMISNSHLAGERRRLVHRGHLACSQRLVRRAWRRCDKPSNVGHKSEETERSSVACYVGDPQSS